MGDFRKLEVWERAHRLTLDVHEATRSFPKDELFSLTSQLRRAASSVPANIAEGCGRNGDAGLGRYLTMAMGSANELDYHLLLAHDLGYLPSARHAYLSTEAQGVAKMLASFIDRLRHSNGRRPIANKSFADSR